MTFKIRLISAAIMTKVPDMRHTVWRRRWQQQRSLYFLKGFLNCVVVTTDIARLVVRPTQQKKSYTRLAKAGWLLSWIGMVGGGIAERNENEMCCRLTFTVYYL